MKILTINIPNKYYDLLKKLSDKNSEFRMYPSVSEAVRQAIKNLLIQDFNLASNLESEEHQNVILNAVKMTKEMPKFEDEMENIEAVQINDEIFFSDNTKVKLVKKMSELPIEN